MQSLARIGSLLLGSWAQVPSDTLPSLGERHTTFSPAHFEEEWTFLAPGRGRWRVWAIGDGCSLTLSAATVDGMRRAETLGESAFGPAFLDLDVGCAGVWRVRVTSHDPACACEVDVASRWYPMDAELESAVLEWNERFEAADRLRNPEEKRDSLGDLATALGAIPETDGGLARALAECELARAWRRVAAPDRAADAFEHALSRLSESWPPTCAERAHATRLFGDVATAAGRRELSMRVLRELLELQRRVWPEGSDELALTRVDLADAIRDAGRLAEARAVAELALATLERTRTGDDEDLTMARDVVSAILLQMGEHERAAPLIEAVVAARERTLTPNDPSLLAALQNLAGIWFMRGDLVRARDAFRTVLEARLRSQPEDHADVLGTRMNLAAACAASGDLASARAVFSDVEDILKRSRTADDPLLVACRANLASTLYAVGDFVNARVVMEPVVAARSRQFGESDVRTIFARNQLALSLADLAEGKRAVEVLEPALEAATGTLAADHPLRVQVEAGMALALETAGDRERARVHTARAVEPRTTGALATHQAQAYSTRMTICFKAGELREALDAAEHALDALETHAPTSTNMAISIRGSEIGLAALVGDAEDFFARVAEYSRVVEALIDTSLLSLPPRELELKTDALENSMISALGALLVRGADPALVEQVFRWSESARAGSFLQARLMHSLGDSTDFQDLERALQVATQAWIDLVRADAEDSRLGEAIAARDRAELSLVERLRTSQVGSTRTMEPARLAAALGEPDALVAYRVVGDMGDGDGRRAQADTLRLAAFVLRREGKLRIFDLGPLEPIYGAITEWRAATLGVADPSPERGIAVSGRAEGNGDAVADAVGRRLRACILDPLESALSGARRIHLLLDDPLYLIPFDALREESGGLAGDRREFHVHLHALELLPEDVPRARGDAFVAIGGIDFERTDAGSDSPGKTTATAPAGGVAALLRAGPLSSFSSLPSTRAEIDSLERLVADRPELAFVSFTDDRATRDALLAAAPRARFLHLATHGFVRNAAATIERTGRVLAPRAGAGAFSALSLCGIALAGANGRADVLGRVPGLLSGEELATLDLEGCEVAVLSACETALGVAHFGKSAASLQRALHLAGARQVVTSLWKVPDKATQELMVEFYRRLLAGEPASRALWQAKTRLRDATDESGRRRYATRDWAAWILTGEAD